MVKDRNSRRQAIARVAGDPQLVVLGYQFDAAVAKLLSMEMHDPDSVEANSRLESLLASMEPIEREIMALPARTMAGLAVKARLAAHIVSNYWDVPLERLDLDARAFRLLVDAVCAVAGVSLPFSPPTGLAVSRGELVGQRRAAAPDPS
jgi:hypothetical protein